MGKGVRGAPTPSLWTLVLSLQTPAVGEALEGEGFSRPLLPQDRPAAPAETPARRPIDGDSEDMTDPGLAHRPTRQSDPGHLGREPLSSTGGAGGGREWRVIGSHRGH